MGKASKKVKDDHQRFTFPTIIGNAYEQLKGRVTRFAEEDYPVLFVGERGSGKELFAQYFMASSKRTGGKMTQNCAGLSEKILQAELFGHIAGTFTDAKKNRPGKLKACDKGIVFLDEIGDASEHLQAAILRVAGKNITVNFFRKKGGVYGRINFAWMYRRDYSVGNSNL